MEHGIDPPSQVAHTTATTVEKHGSFMAAQNLSLGSSPSPPQSVMIPSSQSQDDAFVSPSHIEDEVHHSASESQHSFVPSSQSQEQCGFTFPPMPHSSPERGHSQFEVVPSSQSQERDYVWSNGTGAASSRTRTSSDELVPTSQCEEVELHMPERSRDDDDLWLIGLNRTGENTGTRPQGEQKLVESPQPIENGRDRHGYTPSVNIPNAQPHIDEDNSVGARSELQARYVAHMP